MLLKAEPRDYFGPGMGKKSNSTSQLSATGDPYCIPYFHLLSHYPTRLTDLFALSLLKTVCERVGTIEVNDLYLCIIKLSTGRKRRLGFGKRGKNSFTVQRSEEVVPGEMRGAGAGVSRASSASSENDEDRLASAGDIDTIVRPGGRSRDALSPTHSLPPPICPKYDNVYDTQHVLKRIQNKMERVIVRELLLLCVALDNSS